MRATSRVMLILALRSGAEEPAPSYRPGTRASVEVFLDGLRIALADVGSDDDFIEVLTSLMERGRRTSETYDAATDALDVSGFDDIR